VSQDQSSFQMTVSRKDVWTVSLAGELDASAGVALRSFASLLATSPSRVDFDLSGVQFIDTAGWASVCAARAALEAAGVKGRIVSPSRSVRHLTDVMARTHGPRRQSSRRPRLALVGSESG
jgi:anti-anti-sigma factor